MKRFIECWICNKRYGLTGLAAHIRYGMSGKDHDFSRGSSQTHAMDYSKCECSPPTRGGVFFVGDHKKLGKDLAEYLIKK